MGCLFRHLLLLQLVKLLMLNLLLKMLRRKVMLLTLKSMLLKLRLQLQMGCRLRPCNVTVK